MEHCGRTSAWARVPLLTKLPTKLAYAATIVAPWPLDKFFSNARGSKFVSKVHGSTLSSMTIMPLANILWLLKVRGANLFIVQRIVELDELYRGVFLSILRSNACKLAFVGVRTF